MKTGNRRYWLFQLLGWGVFVIVHLFFTWSFDKLVTENDRQLFLGRIGIYVMLGIALTHIMRSVIIRQNLLQKKLEVQIPQFVLLTLAFATIGASADTWLIDYFNLTSKTEKEILEKKGLLILVFGNMFSTFIYYFIWNVIYFMYHYISKSRRQQVDTLKLETMVKGLELQTIKAHINPHFIFNSLNSIRALVDENPDRARRAITELSNILRSSMHADKAESVPLEKELDIVRDYLALENMRFEDRLQVSYHIDENTLGLPVPPMMLQTLVENAIKHGISKHIEGGSIRVLSRLRNGQHEMSVENTGRLNGYKNGGGEAKTRGFGISGTTERLAIMYGDKATFEIKQAEPELVEAKVSIPLEKM